jgi:hypothetical protein
VNIFLQKVSKKYMAKMVFKDIFNAKFIWPSGFRGEDFLEINQSETRIACGGQVC